MPEVIKSMLMLFGAEVLRVELQLLAAQGLSVGSARLRACLGLCVS